MADQPLILIVDDELSFLEIFRAKLSEAGFRVETASSGREGIEKAKTLKPSLILLDVKMPEISGADVLLKIKEDPAIKDIDVVFLTNFGDPRAEIAETQDVEVKFSKESGAKGYLRKTDDLDLIVAQVKSFL